MAYSPDPNQWRSPHPAPPTHFSRRQVLIGGFTLGVTGALGTSGCFKTPFRRVSVDAVTLSDRGEIIRQDTHQVEIYEETVIPGITLNLVRIPGGDFMMGAPESEEDGWSSQRPVHRVAVPEFWMGQYAVTQAQWDALMDNNPSRFKGPKRPVDTMSWHDAIAFCQRLSDRTGKDYRLPSEAEWEYACRAGTTTQFHFGSVLTVAVANYHSTAIPSGEGPWAVSRGPWREETVPVGSLSANAFGLHEMHGNVWEWCADDYFKSYEGAPSDGSAWLGSEAVDGFPADKVLRGGSWIASPWTCRSAERLSFSPENRDAAVGFRVCCTSIP